LLAAQTALLTGNSNDTKFVYVAGAITNPAPRKHPG